ncbi:Ig-like domain-containing protein [Algisphaera agarilytica]|uniref:Glucose/arabinose dehydrogenase n=1 Tax=Algisphaera agarilytica TaxID=1385975 RepID=A0A7X0H5W2_9BACT|nr:Ig-like domain-containing protein [Algisphaera agarilytica]MBB6428380.1 glucose/arabinose dehydrogenase [Algisphaera agarilytica]
MPQFEAMEPRVLFNASPYADQDNISIINDNGAAVVLDLLSNDTDADGDPLRIESITDPQFATAEIINDGQNVRFTPQVGQTDLDFFIYTLSDGNGGTNIAYVVLDITLAAGSNNTPYADQDAFNVENNGTPIALDVLANDSDPDGDPLFVSAILEVQSGSVEIVNGNTVYTPATGFTGQDFYVYELSDGRGGTDIAYSVIQVAPGTANATPYANPDDVIVDQGLGEIVIDVTLNDSDDDGDNLSASQILLAPGAGSARIENGLVYYTAPDGILGDDPFIVQITDGRGGFDSANVNITLRNTPPTAVDDTLTLEQDSGTASVGVLANDSDPGGDAISIDSVTQGANGSVAISGSDLLYTPQAGFSGADSFTYTIIDANGATATANVAVTVEAVNRGTLALGGSSFDVVETDAQVVIPVRRTGGSDGRVEADFVVIDGTALAGADYVAASGTVVFEDGQTVAEIRIDLINDTDIEGTESFGVSLDRVGGGAGLGAPRTALINIEDDEQPIVGNGLLGEYFDNQNFTNIALRRNDPTINFNWGGGSPDPVLGADTFSIRWTGQVQAEFTETYTFRTVSDDGVRLKVNGQTVIDKFILQGATSHTGSIDLVAGEKVDIEIEYFEAGGAAVMELFWSSASQVEELVPTAALFSETAVPVEQLTRLETEVVVSGLSQPTAIEFTADGTMFILQKDGRVYTVAPGGSTPTLFVDHRAAVNNVRDRGALGLALHPDFPNTPYIYMAYTYDPPETVGQSGLAAPDQFGNRGARVSRFTADASTGYTTAVAGSELVILGTNSTWDNIVRPDLDSTGNFSLPPSGYDENGDPIRDFIATDSQSHTIGGLDFGLDGSLYVTIGDGTSYGNVDPRTTRVQDIDNLSGKVLRVDPLTGQGLSDNPFYDGDPDSNRSKVYAFGLRNPYRNAINPNTGELYIGDVGWNRWEEINVASAPVGLGGAGGGENFGWPYYEGGNGVSLQQVTGYQNLSEAQAFYASNPDVTAPFWAKSHSDGARAIILGDFNTGSTYTGYENALFFLDYQKPTIQAALFNADGTFDREVTAADTPGNVVEMTMGVDGFMYWVDLNGNVGRLTFPSV